jgi:hypothetical protein
MKVKGSVLWIVSSATCALLAIFGLLVLMPIKESQLGFLLFFVVIILLWISSVTLLVSLLCWVASKAFPLKKV